MGSFAVPFFGLRYPERSKSVVPVCRGHGAQEGWEDIHKKNFNDFADALEVEGEAFYPRRILSFYDVQRKCLP